LFKKFNPDKSSGGEDNEKEEENVHLELNSPEQVDRIVKDYKMVYITKHQPRSLKRRNQLSPLNLQREAVE